MKLFTTPTLKRDTSYGGPFVAHRLSIPHSGYEYRYWFCVEAVLDIFNLPKTTMKVWFEFYDRAGVDRWPIELVDLLTKKDDALVTVDGIERLVSGYTARFLFKRLDYPEKCFVACYYEAEGEAPEPI